MSKSDRRNAKNAKSTAAVTDRNGVPNTLVTIPLEDPHTVSGNPSLGELVRDATTQMSALVRAEVELARAEITRDVKKGLTGSVFFVAALVVLFYSTFFFFVFLAELLDVWLWRWVAFAIVFASMGLVALVLALFGFLKVRRIRGPRQTIATVKETRSVLRPDHDKAHHSGASHQLGAHDGRTTTDPSGW
ncbi:MAG TPA: phage holin family protein [Mycobacterium sp.]|nr:phage holin family protein [Mycobacterium sp.]